MSFKEQARHFLVIYNNGDTFFFTVLKTGEMYCKEFSKQYTQITGKVLPGATTVEFTENNIELKTTTGETIYSLAKYHQLNGITTKEVLEIEKFYIDSDVRQEMLDKNKIAFSENLTQIPGLLDEVEVKRRTKTKSPRRN